MASRESRAKPYVGAHRETHNLVSHVISLSNFSMNATFKALFLF